MEEGDLDFLPKLTFADYLPPWQKF